MSSNLAWVKSSYSGTEGGNCVEVAPSPSAVHVRDSKDKAGPTLTFSPSAWSAFVSFAAEAQAATIKRPLRGANTKRGRAGR